MMKAFDIIRLKAIRVVFINLQMIIAAHLLCTVTET